MSAIPESVWGWKIRHPQMHIPVDDLESWRTESDDLADSAFRAMADRYPQVKTGPADTLGIALKAEMNVYRNVPSSEAAHQQDPRVAAFLQSACSVPEWLDWELLKEGQTMFMSYSTSSAMALLYFSLIGGFSAPKIIAVLDKTGYLTKGSRNSTYRRLNETLEMVVDCIEDDDALREGNRGWQSVLKVRLLHARVRHRILTASMNEVNEAGADNRQKGADEIMDTSTNRVTEGWDSKENGVPINQEDLVGTLLSFSINVIETLERIGAPFLTERERIAYLHLWRYIGYLIGVREEYNPCSSVSRARGAVESIVLHLLHPNESSKVIANHVIRSVSFRPPTQWSPGMHAQMARGLLGNELSDALDLPRDEDDFVIRLYSVWVFFVLRILALLLPFLIHRKSERGRIALGKARKNFRVLTNRALERNGMETLQTEIQGARTTAKTSGCPFGYTADSGVIAPHPLPQ